MVGQTPIHRHMIVP